MASSHSSHSQDKPIRFFKIILSDIDSHTKLMLPRKYVSIYGKKLKDRIFLKAPSGSVWSIDLEKQRDKVWLQNGWPEFAKFYSISFGHMLVFEYQGNSKFQVLMFDPSASEMEYPLISSEKKKRVLIEIDDSSTSSDDFTRPFKKTRATFSRKEDDCHYGQKLQQQTKNVNGGLASEEEKDRALSLANAFISTNPFFIHAIKPLNVDGGYPDVYIKKTFEEAYKKWKNNDPVILEVEGRIWPVYCNYNSNCNQCRIIRGWAGLARDNSLNVGDVCVFELINPTRKLIKVIIFRAAKGKGNKRILQSDHGEEATVVASVKSFKSMNPFFTVNVYPSSLYGGSIGVSKKFIKKYITKDKHNVILQLSDGRAWSVNCNVSTTSTKFGAGWMLFAQENNLAPGDVCVFELINSSKCLLNVVIFRNESSEFK